MNKWYIGQPIVCIKSSPYGEIKEGADFLIQGLGKMPCCGSIIIDVGVSRRFQGTAKTYKCGVCGTYGSTNQRIPSGFSERRFAPLDQDISELTEILTQEEPIKI